MTWLPDQFARLLRPAAAEPRKVAALGVLVLLLSVLAWRQLGPGPQAAAAMITSDAPTPNKATSLRRRLPESPVTRWLMQPISPLKRNLFSISYDSYGRRDERADFGPGRGNSKEDEKFGPGSDEVQFGRRQRIEDVRSQARQLHIASILMGSSPRVVLNDRLVGVGDSVAGFRVLRIEPRSVIVEREGIRLEITMK